MKKGAAYLSIWMEVVRGLNAAVADCQAGLGDAAYSIDAAAVLYTGSLTAQQNDQGILLFALAEVRAHQMNTGGHLGDNSDDATASSNGGSVNTGDSAVNAEIMREFNRMQAFVTSRDCTGATASKVKIVTLMKIPMIQGVMRYAYIRDKDQPTNQQDLQRAQAEGAVFAATILPFVYTCDTRVAKVIHENMKMGATTKFADVKNALERSYACMGIVCKDIGGVWNHTLQGYESGASPCGVSANDKSKKGAAIGGFFGISVGVLLAGWAFLRFRHRLPKLGAKRARKTMPPMYSSGNIAAVTEIA